MGRVNESYRTLVKLLQGQTSSEGIVILGSLWSIGIRVAGAAVTYISMVLLARWMGDEGFGVYSYTMAAVATMAIVPLFGFSYSCVPSISQYEIDNQSEMLRGFLAFGMGFVLVTGTAIALLLAFVIRSEIMALKEYQSALLVGCIALPLLALLSYQSEVFRGFGRAVAAYAPIQFSVPFILLVLAFSLYLATGTLSAQLVVELWLVSVLLMTIVQSVYLWRLVTKTHPGWKMEFDVVTWLGQSVHFFFISLSVVMLVQMDILILGLFVDSEYVGYYSAAARTALLVPFVLQGINALGTREYSRLFRQSKIVELQSLLHTLSHWIFWSTLGISLVFLCGGNLILSIFGAGFTQAYLPLLVLTVSRAYSVLIGPVTALLNVTGHQKTTSRVLLLAVAVGFMLSVTLIPAYGMMGAAIATAITTVLWSVLLHREVRRKLKLETCLIFMKSTKPHKVI